MEKFNSNHEARKRFATASGAVGNSESAQNVNAVTATPTSMPQMRANDQSQPNWLTMRSWRGVVKFVVILRYLQTILECRFKGVWHIVLERPIGRNGENTFQDKLIGISEDAMTRIELYEAKRVIDLAQTITKDLNFILIEMLKSDDAAEAYADKQLIGALMFDVYTKIMQPIFEKFPETIPQELRPPV